MASPARLVVDTPIGKMRAPANIAGQYASKEDEELFSEVRHGAFVDPFALAEIQRRGKLTDYYRWAGLI